MHREQRLKTLDLLSANGIECALFADPESVTWLTGFAPAVQSGWYYFAGTSPLVWVADGQFTLITVDGHPNDPLRYHDEDVRVMTYEGYTIQRSIQSERNLEAALREVFSSTCTQIGVEIQDLPVAVMHILTDVFGARLEVTPIDGLLKPARATKTAEELDKLRYSFMLAGAGHATAQVLVRGGLREIDVWAGVTASIFNVAGKPVLIGNDCVTSGRTANIGGWPKDILIQHGDNVTLDIGVVADGYWSDSCRAYFTAELTQQQRDIHHHVVEALDYAISLIKPGAVARDIDRQVRAFIARAGYGDYPHHTGHGVGVAAHESPRIVPYSEEVLQPGMVIMLEPGIYVPGHISIRLEDAVLVTETGGVVLTNFDRSGRTF